MNILLWVLQAVLAFHTLVGAVWKVSHSEQAVPSLGALPHSVWLALMVVEVLCSVGLLLPAVSASLGALAPVAAGCIAAEMLLFCGVHLSSGISGAGQIIYWLVVAAICAFIVYGRLVVAA